MTSSFSTMVSNISTEANLGTLEQLYINSRYFYLTLTVQALSAFLILFIQTAILILLISFLQLVSFQLLLRYILSIPLILLGIPALWGLGLFLSAIILKYKNITSIYTALSSILFALISYTSTNYYNNTYIFIPFAPASNCLQLLMKEGVINYLSIGEIVLNSIFFGVLDSFSSKI